MRTDWIRRYGPWAVVAGASEGLGAAFADELARRGASTVLIARRAEVLDRLGARLRGQYGAEVRCLALDLAAPDALARVADETAGLEVGLGVYNAAYAPVGAVLERELDDLLRVVEVNVSGPLRFVRTLAPAMVARGRGGLVLMSSLAGGQGTPRLATYAATKAFNTVLAEGLWHELRARGVDVVAACAGAVRTPGYAQTAGGGEAPGTLDAGVVAAAALDALGHGPRVTPGWVNKVASLVVGRWLPRRSAVGVMARSTAQLAQHEPALGPAAERLRRNEPEQQREEGPEQQHPREHGQEREQQQQQQQQRDREREEGR